MSVLDLKKERFNIPIKEELPCDNMSYEKTWDSIQSVVSLEYGENEIVIFLDTIKLLLVINSANKCMSQRTFDSLKKDGIELPLGHRFKDKGKWRFSLDSVVRWIIKRE